MENSDINNIFSSTTTTTPNNSLKVVLQPDVIWEPNTNSSTITTATDPSRLFWTSNHHYAAETGTIHDGQAHAQLLQHNAYQNQSKQASVYTPGGASRLHPDPHLVCLRLGKRHYFEDDGAQHVPHFANMGKRGRSFYAPGCEMVQPGANVPRCQVEGCQVVLVNAKDYHKRHKVCEMHSKAPKVIVLGLEQRFCQQCSRFHVVSEFDDSKRSCRRRLAGHNERRRKSSHDSNVKNPSHGDARSLLSSKSDCWTSTCDLSLRSSAALQELIAENRAAILARQIIHDGDWQVHQHWPLEDHSEGHAGSTSIVNQQHQSAPEQNEWDRFNNTGSHVTLELDLMQTSTSAFGLLTTRARSKDNEEGCSAVWNCLDGAHLM